MGRKSTTGPRKPGESLDVCWVSLQTLGLPVPPAHGLLGGREDLEDSGIRGKGCCLQT